MLFLKSTRQCQPLECLQLRYCKTLLNVPSPDTFVCEHRVEAKRKLWLGRGWIESQIGWHIASTCVVFTMDFPPLSSIDVDADVDKGQSETLFGDSG